MNTNRNGIAMAQTILQQIQELDRQKAALLSGAKEEALTKVEDALLELNALGFNYVVTEKGGSAARTGTRAKSDGPCPICEFRTDPVHDGRRHRSQGASKRAFNAAELKELGLAKV